jgi:hypothetical protein
MGLGEDAGRIGGYIRGVSEWDVAEEYFAIG